MWQSLQGSRKGRAGQSWASHLQLVVLSCLFLLAQLGLQFIHLGLEALGLLLALTSLGLESLRRKAGLAVPPKPTDFL